MEGIQARVAEAEERPSLPRFFRFSGDFGLLGGIYGVSEGPADRFARSERGGPTWAPCNTPVQSEALLRMLRQVATT